MMHVYGEIAHYIRKFIIIIIFTPILNSQVVKESCYALQKVQKSSWNEPYSSSFTKQSCSNMALYRWIRSESRVAEIKSWFLCRRPTDQQACDRNLIIIIIIILFTSRNAYKINKHTSIVRRQKGQLRTRSLANNNSSKSNTEALCCVVDMWVNIMWDHMSSDRWDISDIITGTADKSISTQMRVHTTIVNTITGNSRNDSAIWF